MNSLPLIDGHFWIERDGKIVDTEFKEYDYIKKYHNLADGMVYKETDDFTQKLMIIKFKRCLESYYASLDDYVALKKSLGMDKPIFQDCFYNCLLVLKEGDEIKFGSMGWNKKDGSGVWWEFGGEDWKGIAKFLKKRVEEDEDEEL